MTETLLPNAAVVSILMLTMWAVSVAMKNVAIVDCIWGLGFVLLAWTTWFLTTTPRTFPILAVLTTVWGLRLSLFLLWRNWGKPEDYRYREMRDKHGDRFWLVSLVTVFGLQGVVMWIVALPLQTGGWQVIDDSAPVFAAGIMVWLTGLIFESVGDWQLAAFRNRPDNQGKVMNRGLWRYTRHPNYFGDFCVWWGLFLVSVSSGAPFWSAMGPAVMSVLLLRFSGVRLLEKSLTENKPGYADYMRQTSAFFPLPPRKTS
ncbi:MAG: DUF1295 domain-containing protein [Fuerstiella sp.]